MRRSRLPVAAAPPACMASVSAAPADAISIAPARHPHRQSFTTQDGRFYLIGKPFQMNSGEMPCVRIRRAGPCSRAEWESGSFSTPVLNATVTRACAMTTNHASAAMHPHAAH